MCGRYLIDEEAYSDILEILYRSGAISPIDRTAAMPGPLRDAMLSTMKGEVCETVPGDICGLFPGAPALVTNGEVFPSNIAPVLTSEGPAAIKWGFPHWKNSSVIINARAETALEKQTFRKPLLKRRCVIPSNGFFEWGSAPEKNDDILQIGMFGSGQSGIGSNTGRRSKKQKYLFRLPDESKLYMAGFWSTFRDGTGSEYTAFVILTTAASESVSPVHNRMPLIISPDEKDDWLRDRSFMEYALLRPGVQLVTETAA